MMRAIFVLVSVAVLGVRSHEAPDVVDMSWPLRINKTLYFPAYPQPYESALVWPTSDGEDILPYGTW